MPQTITLKNAAAQDVVFALRSVGANGQQVYISAGPSMLENKRLDLSVVERRDTIRVVGKLSVPVAGSCVSGCEKPSYTEVGSFDLSSVKVASSAVQADFLAMFASFVENAAVTDAYTTGV